MMETPRLLEPEDFFTILTKEPQFIEITDIKITEGLEPITDDNRIDTLKFKIEFYDMDNGAFNIGTYYDWRVKYDTHQEGYYIGLDDNLYPLLSFISNISDTPILVSPFNLYDDVVGFTFKATAKSEKVGRYNYNYRLIPLDEEV